MKLNFFRITLLSAFIFIFECSQAQLFNESLVFLNYKRSIASNFVNAEVQLGKTDEKNFLTVRAGMNYVGYSSENYCPYHLIFPEPISQHEFINYDSKRKGINAGIGTVHYFKTLSNEEVLIPVLGIEANWYMDTDNYDVSFRNKISGNRSSYNGKEKFHSLSADLTAGVLYVFKSLYFNGSFSLCYFLPVNSHTYMATDSYNSRSSTKLPMAGFEPSCQLGIGIKI